MRETLRVFSENIHELGTKHSALGGVHVWKGWRHCVCPLSEDIRQLEESRLQIYAEMNDYEASKEKA